MSIRSMFAVLAASAVSLPAVAATDLASTTSVAQMQVAQSATYSVRNTQDLLNRLGYDAGPVDGIFGSRTQSAIMAYQRDRGLTVTGQPGANLYQHMLATATGADANVTDSATGSTTQASEQTVADVQTQLIRRGYDLPVVSGQVDSATRAAVVAYQRDAGMTATGEVDQQLLASLISSNVTRSEYVAERELVRDIQVALNNLGYNAGTDGTLGLQTQAAIRNYEAANGLPVTGAASSALLARLEPAAVPDGIPADRATVWAIQEELITRGYLDGEADGIMGASTSAAIRAFQVDAGLQVTGDASPTLLSSIRASDVSRRSVAHQRVIAEIEEELRLKGYAVGPVDGVVDTQTAAAIRTFQRDAGLAVDGRADRELLAQIRESRVVAGPATPEQALQGVIQGATTRLLREITE